MEIANRSGTLENLAMQARMFVENACMNLLQLGRVLAEAKPLVPHGEWDAWIRSNAKMSRRAAEQYMQAYAEFGLDSRIAELGTTKVLKLLPMPEQDREKLLSENDVSSMSTRQLDEAIKKQKARLIEEARASVQEEISREREAREAAERRADAAESRLPEVPQEMAEELDAAKKKAEMQQAEIERLARAGRENEAEKDRLARENHDLQQEIAERDELLAEQQADIDKAQEELLNVKSALAKGDAERVPAGRLTLETFTAAVRSFVGSCARMPHMGLAFSGMGPAEKSEYDVLLKTVEEWARGSRRALDSVTVDIEGTVAE